MTILSRKEVEEEMGAVPCKLLYDFYVKEVNGNYTNYTPLTLNSFKRTSEN